MDEKPLGVDKTVLVPPELSVKETFVILTEVAPEIPLTIITPV